MGSNWLVVVGGQVLPDGKGGFRTSTYDDDPAKNPLNPSSIVGCRYRGDAAAALLRQDGNAVIVVLGGLTPLHILELKQKGIPPEQATIRHLDSPLLDEVIANELRELDVPTYRIMRVSLIDEHDRLLGTTFQQLIHCNKLAQGLRPERIRFISNFWQVRTFAMAAKAPIPGNIISPETPMVHYDSAERILLAEDRTSWGFLERIRELPIVQRLCAGEAWGASLVMAGTYQFGSVPIMPPPSSPK